MESAPALPDPQKVFESFTAYQRTEALRGAVRLDLFTAVGEGADSVGAIAEKCRASERGVRILCDALVVDGYLTKDGQRYGLTPEAAAFLDRRSPAYMGSVIDFVAGETVRRAFADVAGAARKGGTTLDAGGSTAPEHPMWVEFARAMASIAGFGAELIANLLEAERIPFGKILDVAAGHGLYGFALAQRNPKAEVVALDWPNVLAVAEEFAREYGVAERFKKLPGSAFTVDLGGDYDVVLLTNFLHHFDPPTCEGLLRRVRAALKPGGCAVTLEFVPDENRVTPPTAAAFALVMLATTPAGDAYTFSELERMFGHAGFSRSELHEIPPSFQRVILSYR